MKPIPSNMSKETLDLLNKAQNMIKRIDVIEKEKTCDKCKGKCTCKDCPECGLSKMGCMAKGGCTTEVEKAQPGFETTFNTNSLNMNPHSTTGMNRLDDGGSKANNYSP